MSRHVITCPCVLLVLLTAAAPGCATYSQDLERARRHYQELEFPRALAVLRLLGEELDGLSPSQRVQFSYLRGMTDLRLADTVPPAGTLRDELRACARDWLDDAMALGRRHGGALTPEQTARAQASLAELIDVEAPLGVASLQRTIRVTAEPLATFRARALARGRPPAS